MNTLKYFGIALLVAFVWNVGGYSHERDIFKACDTGNRVPLYRNSTHSIEDCKIIKH